MLPGAGSCCICLADMATAHGEQFCGANFAALQPKQQQHSPVADRARSSTAQELTLGRILPCAEASWTRCPPLARGPPAHQLGSWPGSSAGRHKVPHGEAGAGEGVPVPGGASQRHEPSAATVVCHFGLHEEEQVVPLSNTHITFVLFTQVWHCQVSKLRGCCCWVATQTCWAPAALGASWHSAAFGLCQGPHGLGMQELASYLLGPPMPGCP